MFQFRDPIHGFVEVSEDEKKIIDSPPFQRLRNIKQLATTYLVYHGAEHTRFGHSIGVMHLVTRAFLSVTDKNKNLFCINDEENGIVTKWYLQILRLIALTHDLGHAPFSHASEALFALEMEHEDYTKLIIIETEIGEYINIIGEKFQSEYGSKYKITPELIWMIYEGKDITNEDYIMPDFVFLKSFMDGELDCDKMDYLLRDSKFCGVSYGKYDLERFISTLTVYKEGSILQLAVEKGGIQAFEEFVLARYFMFIQVYFHKTRRFFDKLLVECLKAVLPENKYPIDLKEYLKWDDVRVLSEMAKKKESNDSIKAYFERRTYTCIYETPAHAGKAEGDKYDIILKFLIPQIGEGNIITDAVDKMAHKLQPVLFSAQDDSGKGVSIIDKYTARYKSIMEESVLLQGLNKPIDIKRIYVPHEKSEEAKEIVGRILN